MRGTLASLFAAWIAAAGCGADIGAPDDETTSGSSADSGVQPDSDAAPRADAAPDEPCVEGWTELLVNPDFDQGPAVGWTSAGDDIILPDADIPISVDSGQYAARLGGRNELDAAVSQPVAIPATASQLRLSARTCFVTVEGAGTPDRVEVVLRDAGGSVAGTLREFTNQDASGICNWGDLQISSSPAHAGEDLTFELHVTTNAANHTSFYFDTLALEALVECGS